MKILNRVVHEHSFPRTHRSFVIYNPNTLICRGLYHHILGYLKKSKVSEVHSVSDDKMQPAAVPAARLAIKVFFVV